MILNVGRMALKIAGRDAGKRCVVVDTLEKGFVLVDGETRRKKCNVRHLEPLPHVLDVAKGASHDDVKKAFEAVGLKVRETKPKQAGAKPVKQKAEKKAAPKAAEKKAPAKKPAPKQEAAPKAEEKPAEKQAPKTE